ncbi:MAG: hemerythrin family protein [Rhodocyclales bacterium]|nr:hemerythrin family protein [Rhodocyclales bacterium]
MDPEYLTGIEEIDKQHLEIEGVAAALIDAVEAHDKWHIVHYIVVRLYELLRFHFTVEEAMMRITGFPEIDEHKRVHQDMLQTVERMKSATLDSDLGRASDLIKTQFSFLSHIVDHDKRLAEFLVANVAHLKR